MKNIEPFNITFDVVPSDGTKPLSLTVKIDNHIAWQNTAVSDKCSAVIEINELADWFDHSLERHCLQFILDGKQSSHTVIDAQGNIVSDSLIKISNFMLDGIDLDVHMHNFSDYTHNFNGTGDFVTDKFYGDMGCNGTAEMKFSTPIYMWLLENL